MLSYCLSSPVQYCSSSPVQNANLIGRGTAPEAPSTSSTPAPPSTSSNPRLSVSSASLTPSISATKKAFDEIKVLRAKGLERRAVNLPPEDQRRMASVFSAYDRFANSFGEGAPLRSTPFSNDEFRVAVQSRLGVPLTCLKPYINQPLKSNKIMPLRSTSLSTLSAATSKNLWGRRVEARRQTTARS